MKKTIKAILEGLRFLAYLILLALVAVLTWLNDTVLPYIILKLMILKEVANGEPKPTRPIHDSPAKEGTCE